MQRRIIGLAGVWISLLATVLAADEIPAGRWTGTFVNLGGRAAMMPQPPRPAAIAVTRSPDPHWRWRPGGGDLLSVTLTLGQNPATVGDMKLEGGVLTFWAMREDNRITCKLALQPEKNYVGECSGEAARLRLSLVPPAPESKDPPQQAPNQP